MAETAYAVYMHCSIVAFEIRLCIGISINQPSDLLCRMCGPSPLLGTAMRRNIGQERPCVFPDVFGLSSSESKNFCRATRTGSRNASKSTSDDANFDSGLLFRKAFHKPGSQHDQARF